MNIHFRMRSLLVADSIQMKLPKKSLDGKVAWSEIQGICQRTVEDLNVILNGLAEFQTNTLHVDQKKRKIFFLILDLYNNFWLFYQHTLVCFFSKVQICYQHHYIKVLKMFNRVSEFFLSSRSQIVDNIFLARGGIILWYNIIILYLSVTNKDQFTTLMKRN